jgi:hypothetical protein
VQPLSVRVDVPNARLTQEFTREAVAVQPVERRTGPFVVEHFGFNYSATASVVLICISVMPAANTAANLIAIESGAVRVSQVMLPQSINPILEMRPAHRSLTDKAREETSEFERNYPW